MIPKCFNFHHFFEKRSRSKVSTKKEATGDQKNSRKQSQTERWHRLGRPCRGPGEGWGRVNPPPRDRFLFFWKVWQGNHADPEGRWDYILYIIRRVAMILSPPSTVTFLPMKTNENQQRFATGSPCRFDVFCRYSETLPLCMKTYDLCLRVFEQVFKHICASSRYLLNFP